MGLPSRPAQACTGQAQTELDGAEVHVYPLPKALARQVPIIGTSFNMENGTNVSIMCPKLWTHYGHILDTSFHTGEKPKCVQSLDLLWTHFLFWTCFGHIMDTFWTHLGFRHILDTLWTHFGHLSRISVQNMSISQLFRSTCSVRVVS